MPFAHHQLARAELRIVIPSLQLRRALEVRSDCTNLAIWTEISLAGWLAPGKGGGGAQLRVRRVDIWEWVEFTVVLQAR